MPREKSVGAIIYRKEAGNIYYLLLHYGNHDGNKGRGRGGHWDFSKGHVEEGETEEQTLRREVKEETGIEDIKIVRGFKENIKYFFRQGYGLSPEEKKTAPWVFKLVVFYLAETKTKEIRISDEHVGFLWLPLEEAVRRVTYKNAKELLKKSNEFVVLEKNKEQFK